MKNRLHPKLSSYTFDDCGNDKYYGGEINLFGIHLNISWSKTCKHWNIDSSDEISDDQMIKVLRTLENAVSSEDLDLIFGDERAIPFSELRVDNMPGDKIFFDTFGRKWMVGKVLYGAEVANARFGIELNPVAGSMSPTGVVADFEDDTIVYIYTKDRE